MLIRSLAIAIAFAAACAPGAFAQGGVTPYCQSGLAGSHISAAGSASFTANGGSGDLVLHANNVGPNAPGLFIMSATAIAPVPFGNGFRCVGGTVLRLPVIPAGAGSNVRTFGLDYLSSNASGMITPGSSWNFQLWFRSGGSFDLSDAVRIDFVPPLPHSFTTIAQGNHSGHPLGWDINGGALIVDDAAEWNTFWDQHAGGVPPTVDFTQDVVLAVFAGYRSTGGFSLAITAVDLSVATLDVSSLEQAPGPGCFVTLALTQPFHFVSVPRVEHMQLGTWNASTNIYTCP